MRLNAPKKKVFWLTVIIAIVGVAAFVVGLFVLPWLNYVGFGVLAAAYILLMLSTALKGL